MSTADPTPPEVRGIPEMPAQVVQHLAKPNDPIVGKVIETRICSPSNKAAAFVRHISIDVSGTVLENGWIAGQSFGVIAPGVTDKGKGHKLRLYSISAPTKGEDGNGSIISTTTNAFSTSTGTRTNSCSACAQTTSATSRSATRS